MIRSYLRTSYRNILKNRISFVISVTGITAGLVVCILISLFVKEELSYDKFHEHSNSIYRVAYNKYKENRLESQNARTFSAYGPALKEEYPEVLDYCRIRPFERGYNKEVNVQFQDERFNVSNVFYADSTIFSVFTFTMRLGNSNAQLKRINTAIISKSSAENFFENQNPIGKTITINDERLVEITGVFNDLPSNSHLNCDVLVSYISVEQNAHDYETRKWDHPWHQVYTYLLLNPKVDYKNFARKLPDFIRRHKPQLAENHEN